MKKHRLHIIILFTLLAPTVMAQDQISVFIEGLYRSHEPEDLSYLNSGKWYSIMLNDKKQAIVEKAQIEIYKSNDDCLGNDVLSTYVSIGNTNGEVLPSQSILLIEGIEFKTQQIPTFIHTQTSFFEGKDYSFQCTGGANYTLSGKSDLEDKSLTEDKTEDDRIVFYPSGNLVNYRLFLNDGKSTQLLLTIPHMNDTMVQLLLIADIDGDGKPDFVFDTSSDYEDKTVEIYLSSFAKKGEIVGFAGSAGYSFDC